MKYSENQQITCCIGLSVFAPAAIRRVNDYRQKVCDIFGYDLVLVKEVHIMLVRSFHTDYRTASALNVALTLHKKESGAALRSTIFWIEGLELMEYDHEDILHFPVHVFGQRDEGGNFAKSMESYRHILGSFGVKIRHPIPPNYTRHISLLSVKGISTNKRVRRMIKESKSVSQISFQATYPTVYVKERGIGYVEL